MKNLPRILYCERFHLLNSRLQRCRVPWSSDILLLDVLVFLTGLVTVFIILIHAHFVAILIHTFHVIHVTFHFTVHDRVGSFLYHFRYKIQIFNYQSLTLF